MNGVNKILTAALAAGVFGGAGTAMADYRYTHDSRMHSQFYGSPNEPRVGLGRSVTADINTGYYSSRTYYPTRSYSYSYATEPTYYYYGPSTYQYDRTPTLLETVFAPLTGTPSTGYDYYPNRGWGQYYSVGSGYYGNRYHPYWAYQGPLGQGSGHDMGIGR